MSLLSTASAYIIEHLKNPATQDKILSITNQTTEQIKRESGKISLFFKKLFSYPITIIASFVFSPILMLRVILFSKSRAKKFIAIAGLLFAFLVSYTIVTGLGIYFWFGIFAKNFGILSGVGFLLGSSFSVVITVTICTIVFNFICFVFLKMNNDEVIQYLKDSSS